jgi:type IV secretion system protein VirB6
MTVCAAPGTGGAFLAEMLSIIDCQAQAIGMGGYQALAAPTSPIALVLAALLTIFIAAFGIRMLLGQIPTVSGTVLAFIKIGIVLTLASSWAAYRVVAYDVILEGPAELFADIGSGAGLPGADGGLVQRLQTADNGIVALTTAGSGQLDIASVPQAGSTFSDAAPMVVADGFALGTARVAYLGSTIAALGIVRLAGGMLLALAPLFAGFLLFETTRFLFMGWLRALVGTVLGGLAVAIVLGVEMAILEPWLATVLARRAARIAAIAAPVELLVITLAFAIILFSMIVIGMRVAWANVAPIMTMQRFRADAAVRAGQPFAHNRPDAPPLALIPSRPLAIADAIAAAQRREDGIGGWRTPSIATRTTSDPDGATLARGVSGITPLGQSYHRTTSRVSAASRARSSRK